jgi:predicted Zn-dependent protease
MKPQPASMIGSASLLGALAQLVRGSPADGTTVYAQAGTRRVMRFAYESVHQDLLQENLTVYVKVLVGQRTGVAATNLLDRASLQRSLRAALQIARHTPPATLVPELPGPFTLTDAGDYDAATMAVDPDRLVEVLRRLFRLAKGAGAQLAGSLALGDDERAVVNSRGVAAYHAATVSGLKLVTLYRACSGYASGVDRRFAALDCDRLLEQALRQCLHRRAPVTPATGTYEVILEPEAVAELVNWLGYITFGAKSFQERTSALVGRIGEPLAEESITIVDDAHDTAGLRSPFDCEGVPAQRVPLIDQGKAAGIVYDTAYGARYRHPSTGHALPPDEPDGPLPTHLLMEPGAATRQEMIRGCTRGLLIPRFHYVNGLLNPREALMTGLTREGACLIERGKITAPITTMRFTQSFFDALQSVLAVSRERELVADPVQDHGSCVMPTLHLAKFKFTGSSES